MNKSHRHQHDHKNVRRFRPFIFAMTTAFLLLPTTQNLFAATDFQGSLTGVSISDTAGTNTPPVANFTYTQDEDTFTFDASESYDSDGSITEYKWDFGDGESASGIQVSHTFVSATSYPVTLQAIDDNNGISIIQTNVSNILIVEQLIGDSDTGNISVVKSYGQGIYFTEAKTVQSIIIKTGPTLYGTPPAKLRIGTSKDLSTSFLVESDEVLLTAKNTEYKFIMTEPVQLSAQTQYYFAVSITNDLSSNFVDLSTSATDSYSPDDCPDCHLYYKNTAKWNVSGIKYTKDLFFRITQ